MVVVPDATPVTTPAELMVATDVLEEDQAPPAVASVNAVVAVVHNDDAPDMLPALGSGLTVITCVADAEPHPVVTV